MAKKVYIGVLSLRFYPSICADNQVKVADALRLALKTTFPQKELSSF